MASLIVRTARDVVAVAVFLGFMGTIAGAFGGFA